MTQHAEPSAFLRLAEKNSGGQSISLPNGHAKRARTDKVGFVPAHDGFHTFYNRSIGVLALCLAAPLMLLISLALLVTQGPEIFYAGKRLGKGRSPFPIYKFRTLDTAKAKILTADKVLPAGSNLETPLGKYLRASRLDELPQLFNIVRGDMNIVGPRPVRAEIAAIEEARNPHYTVRFSVKPGMVGHTQAYMCHGTSKRIRAKHNYSLCVNRVNYASELALFFGVGLAVLSKAVSLIGKELRRNDPLEQAQSIANDWDLYIVQGNSTYSVLGYTGDNGLSLADRALSGAAELVIRTRNGGLRRAKIMLQPLSYSTNPVQSHRFDCATELSSHLVARFLDDSAVVGPRPMRKSLAQAPAAMPQGAQEAA